MLSQPPAHMSFWPGRPYTCHSDPAAAGKNLRSRPFNRQWPLHPMSSWATRRIWSGGARPAQDPREVDNRGL